MTDGPGQGLPSSNHNTQSHHSHPHGSPSVIPHSVHHDARGHLCLVLHAHLPWVRHVEDHYLEEQWLYEAMLESYLPLLAAFLRLDRDRVPCRFTLSLSPTLCEMLAHPDCQARFRSRMDKLAQLADLEAQRYSNPDLRPAVEHYRERIEQMRDLYEALRGDLLGAFGSLRDAGILELITTSATHAILPLTEHTRSVHAQIRAALRCFDGYFGGHPPGLWLPECAYREGLEAVLAAEGVGYFFLDSHGLLFSEPRPQAGLYAPVLTPTGVAAFGRDLEASKQVWDAQAGYPGDPVYREFYRDLGHDLDWDLIAPYLSPAGVRHDVGLKYYRVTGAVDLGHKEPYDPARARLRAREHAADFLEKRRLQAEAIRQHCAITPVVVAPYDAELFGHWWYEGPVFLEALARAAVGGPVALVSPSDVLAARPREHLQPVKPGGSTWGDKGYFETWLNGANDWIPPLVHGAELRMRRFAGELSAGERDTGRSIGPLTLRAANQAAREVLLAQSSDWPFILTTRSVPSYATRRVKDHVARVHQLLDACGDGSLSESMLAAFEAHNPIFPYVDFRIFLP